MNKSNKIALLKIDVEGYELPVLSGAKNILDRTENLIIELSPNLMQQPEIEVNTIVQLLYAKHFRPYLLEKNKKLYQIFDYEFNFFCIAR